MAKSVLSGEMKTRITIKSLVEGIDADGFPTENWTDLFGGQRWCKVVYAHGNESFENARLNLGELATITMRYTPLVNVRNRIWIGSDDQDDKHAWEIVGVNNVEGACRFLELTIRRSVKA